MHRDIKLENILIENSNDFSTLKLADFGFSIKLHSLTNSDEKISRAGTFHYMAPELFEHNFKIS